MEKKEPSCTVDGNAKLLQPLWKTVWGFLKKLKIELPYDPVIALLDTYPKNTITLIEGIFIAALSTIARLWKQPKCPSIDKWIKKMWYTVRYHLTPVRMAKINW